MKRIIRPVLVFLLALLLVPSLPAFAGTGTPLVKPNTFSAGSPAVANQVNANFDALYDRVNLIQADQLVPAAWQATVPLERGTFLIDTDYVYPKDVGALDVKINTVSSYLTYQGDGSFLVVKGGLYQMDVGFFVEMLSYNTLLNVGFLKNGSEEYTIQKHFADVKRTNAEWSRTISCDAGDTISCVIRGGRDGFYIYGTQFVPASYHFGDPYFQIRYLGPATP